MILKIIIMADEPTVSNDSKNASIVLIYLKNLTTEFNQTVLAVTHDSQILPKPVIELLNGRFGKIL
jgi:lipoprotein-releasing system ATP-binding protein